MRGFALIQPWEHERGPALMLGDEVWLCTSSQRCWMGMRSKLCADQFSSARQTGKSVSLWSCFGRHHVVMRQTQTVAKFKAHVASCCNQISNQKTAWPDRWGGGHLEQNKRWVGRWLLLFSLVGAAGRPHVPRSDKKTSTPDFFLTSLSLTFFYDAFCEVDQWESRTLFHTQHREVKEKWHFTSFMIQQTFQQEIISTIKHHADRFSVMLSESERAVE